MKSVKYKYRPIKRGKAKNREDAYFQFLLDHATPVTKGWHVQFFYKNKKDLRARIQARQCGLERLDSVNEEWREVQKLHQEYVKMKEDMSKLKGWRLKVYKWLTK